MDFKKSSNIISISTGTILKVILILIVFGLLYLIREIVGIVFIAWVLTSAITPLVDKMNQKRIPRWLAIIFIYFILIGVIALAIYLVIPPIITQINQLSTNFPDFYQKVADFFASAEIAAENAGIMNSIQSGLESLSASASNLSGGILSTLASIFGGFISFLAVLVITFYMTMEEDGMKKFIKSVLPLKYQPYFISKTRRVQHKMGMWLRGQLVLSLIIGVLSYVGLLILKVDYALILALLVAVMEFIPYVGPILGGIPAVFIALTQSPLKAVLVLILYLIIQQLENSVISPKVMQKAVGLNPIMVIVSLLIGAKLFGFVGVLLAVPVATIISVFLEDFFESKKRAENKLEGKKEVEEIPDNNQKK